MESHSELSRKHQASTPGSRGSFLSAAKRPLSLPYFILAGVSSLLRPNTAAREHSPSAASDAGDVIKALDLQEQGYDGDSEEESEGEEIRIEVIKPEYQDSTEVEEKSSIPAQAISMTASPLAAATLGVPTVIPTVEVAKPPAECYSPQTLKANEEILMKIQEDKIESLNNLPVGGSPLGDVADQAVKYISNSPAKISKEELEKFQVEEFAHLIGHSGPALKYKLFVGANPDKLDSVADETVLNGLGWSDIDSNCSEYVMSPFSHDSDLVDLEKWEDSVRETPLKRRCSELSWDKPFASEFSGAAHITRVYTGQAMACSAR